MTKAIVTTCAFDDRRSRLNFAPRALMGMDVAEFFVLVEGKELHREQSYRCALQASTAATKF